MDAVRPQINAPVSEHEPAHAPEHRRYVRHVVGDSLALHPAKCDIFVVLSRVLFGHRVSALKTTVSVDARDAADEENVVGLDGDHGTGGRRRQNCV